MFVVKIKLVVDVKKAFIVGEEVSLRGRITAKRNMRNIVFFTLRDRTDFIQLIWEKYANNLNMTMTNEGDIVYVEGKNTFSETGEKSLLLSKVDIITKTQIKGGIREKCKQKKTCNGKIIDNILNQEKSQYYADCSHVVLQIRKNLYDQDFLEFNTGILHSSFDGGYSQPFETFLEKGKRRLYLRPTLEIRLKQLLASGYEKVFEIGNVFRNGSFNSRNSPEFVLLECYQAFADYNIMMEILEKTVKNSIQNVFSEKEYTIRVKQILGIWEKKSFLELINKINKNVQGINSNDLKNFLVSQGLTTNFLDEGQLVRTIIQKILIPRIENPTYITDLPLSVFPLAKSSNHNKKSEAAILAFDGEFLGEVYTDENNPQIIESRLNKQMVLSGRKSNIDFIELLRFGLPPSAGFGLGINRLLLTFRGDWKKDIQETFVFRPLK
jgi:lysyl-tRNA synthetase class 2